MRFKMSEGTEGGGGIASEFKTTFSLIGHVLKICKSAQAVQNDPQKSQAAVSGTLFITSH